MQPQKFKVVIQKRQHQNQFFDEVLAEGVSLRMMSIPGGEFLMGSPQDEIDRSDSESPQHLVTVKPFFFGKYPVTQAQWRIVAAMPQVNRPLDADPAYFKGDQNPVENVSWHDAIEFCARLSQHTERLYRLPSEAEWEYACRAGTTTPFHFGETITTELANYRGTDDKDLQWSGSYGKGTKGEYRQKTTPVDYFEIANTFGLCEMHGNVWEWCEDNWHRNYEGAPVDGSAWVDNEAEEDAVRVLRGGSWFFNPRSCRSATRNGFAAGSRFNSFGFRVVCLAPRTL